MELSPQGIPIIDISAAINNGHSVDHLADVAKHMSNACQTTGSFYIRNHGVDQALIESMRRDLHCFFTQPLDYKVKYQRTDKGWTGCGYYPFQTVNTYAYMGEKDRPNDQLETFVIGPDKCRYPTPANIYPDHPATLKGNIATYYAALREVGMTLARILAVAINAPDPDYFVRNTCDAPHALAGNYFPAYSKPDRTQESWLPTHTDAAMMAIIALDPSCPRSLRVKNTEGKWLFADPIPGTFFVNTGHPLQRWTNDKFIAPEHGVVWPETDEFTDRMSVAFVIALHPDAVIECLPSCGKAKYEPITFQGLVEKPLEDFHIKHT